MKLNVKNKPNTVTRMYAAQIEGNTGLPGWAYYSEEAFEQERKRIFLQTWLCVACAQDVPVIGDISPINALGYPLLLVRQTQTRIRVYHNVCCHRGAQLARAKRSCRGGIVCPYHSWTYSLDGKLKRTPHIGGPGKHQHDSLSTGKIELSEVQSEQWCDLIFVNLSGAAPSFDEFISPIRHRLGQLDPATFRFDTKLSTGATVNANWKIVIENFVESYHVPSIHPELERVNPMHAHYQILGGHSYLGQGGMGYRAAERGKLAGLPPRQDLEDSSYEAFYIFPNLIFGPLPNFGFLIFITPISAELTHERIEFMFYGDEAMRDNMADVRKANAEFLRLINCQDIEICESIQIGRKSPAFKGGVFAEPQEATSLHFLRMVAARMIAGDADSVEDTMSLPTENVYHETLIC